MTNPGLRIACEPDLLMGHASLLQIITRLSGTKLITGGTTFFFIEDKLLFSTRYDAWSKNSNAENKLGQLNPGSSKHMGEEDSFGAGKLID